MPAVSILTVFHRDSPFLRPAIASALNQSWRDLELVLVDNGTGMSPAELGESGRDPRVRWVRLPKNEGIPAGHNAGVAAARGEFIGLLDYDDLAKRERIERQLEFLRSRPDVGLVSGLAERIDEHGKMIGRVFCLPRAEEHAIYAPYGGPVVLASALVRREVLAALPYRAEFPFAADLDFQARASERWKFHVIPEVHLSYRWYDAQTTQQRRREVEQSRSILQLATARRRAGRPEELAGVLAAAKNESAAATWRRVSAICWREKFLVAAAYQARRSMACERSIASFRAGVALGWRAVRHASAVERSLVVRMFLRGPVRALSLNPL